MKYYIFVADKNHVELGVKEGFAQAGHGKKSKLINLKKDDWIIYYSPREKYPDGKAYRKFTAIGQVTDGEPLQATISPYFHPWRRKIKYYASNDLDIKPFIDELEFIANKKKWGFYLMSGFVEIGEKDFMLIAGNMLKYKKLRI